MIKFARCFSFNFSKNISDDYNTNIDSSDAKEINKIVDTNVYIL